MTQPGSIPTTLRGERGWGSLTRESVHDTGVGRLQILEGGFISSDGSELRAFPGWKCVWDPVTDRATGYRRLARDCVRPVAKNVGDYRKNEDAQAESLWIRAYETNIHGLEFVRGRPILYGESGVMFEEIYNGTTLQVGFPPLGTLVTITNASVAASCVLTTNFSADVGSTFHRLTDPAGGANIPYPVNQGDVIFIEGMTLPPGGTPQQQLVVDALNNKFHKITAIAGTAITISTSTLGGTAIAGQTGSLFRTRIGSAYLTGGSDYPQTYAGTVATQDVESLTIWYANSPLADNAATVRTQTYPAHVFNRQRDCGDETGSPFEGTQFAGGATTFPFSRRCQKALPYRLNSHPTTDRLILAAPGYGCVFQAPVLMTTDPTLVGGSVGIAFGYNDITDKPRCLGVPKAVMFVDTATPPGVNRASAGAIIAGMGDFAFGGSDASVVGRNGTYQWKVAYRDDATGEIGLPSEPISILFDASTVIQFPILYIMHPGYLMPETGALSVLAFRTEVNGTTFYFDSVVNSYQVLGGGIAPVVPTINNDLSYKYGLDPQPVAAIDSLPRYIGYKPLYKTGAALVNQEYVPSIEQQPRGCEDVDTVRGWSFFAGAIGDSGPDGEMSYGTVTSDYTVTGDAVYGFPNVITIKPNYTSGRSGVRTGTFSIVASPIVPHSYAGSWLSSVSLWPYPTSNVRIGSMLNNRMANASATAAGGEMGWVRYSLQAGPFDTTRDAWTSLEQSTYLLHDRVVFQVSERSSPGVTPAANEGQVDSNKSDAIVAVGQASGQALLSSKYNTFMVGWSDTPIIPGVGATSPSTSFPHGCIGARTMVEFDGGAAWISSRGPCAMIGDSGATWIGQEVGGLFYGENPRYKCDSKGMMRHAWGCHDPVRGLVYWGLYANYNPALTVTKDAGFTTVTWNAGLDRDKSRFPCDEILIWNYRVNSFSTFRPPSGMEALSFTRGTDNLGVDRIYWLAADKRVYVLDDSYAQGNKDVLELTALTASTGTTVLTTVATFGASTANQGNGENLVKLGQTVVVTDSTKKNVKAVVTVVSAAAPNITLSQAVSVASGDKLLVGCRTMTATWNYKSFKNHQLPATVKSVDVRLSHTSRISTGAGGIAQPCWIQARDTVDRRPGGDEDDPARTSQTQAFTADDTNANAYEFAGFSAATTIGRSIGCKTGNLSGLNHSISITALSAGQLRISDINLEVS